jgi:hypothetical protein
VTDHRQLTAAKARLMSDSAAAGPSPEELKQALKAFKKRLKLTRLDAESKVGKSPLTGGANWGITAIMPPNQYPPAIWDELVKQGRLKPAGHGLLSLGEP